MKRRRRLWIDLLVILAYVGAGRAGLLLTFVNPTAADVWPPSGVALAAILLLGPRAALSVVAGAFIINMGAIGSIAPSLLIATGNAAEALIGAHLVTRFADGRRAFDNVPNVFRFVVSAGLLSTMVSATIGVTSLSAFGFASWADYLRLWTTWWLGNATGVIIVTPIVLLWAAKPNPGWSKAQAAELLLLVAVSAGAAWLAFEQVGRPLSFLAVPLCIWAAFRFGPREAATATGVLSTLALWATAHGFGPFAGQAPHAALLSVQTFMAVATVVSLTASAVTAEHRRIEQELRGSNADLERHVAARTAELVAAQAHLAGAQEVAHIGSWEWSVEGGRVWWSEELYRVCGLDPAQFEPTYEGFLARVHPDDRAKADAASQRCLRHGEPFEVEHRIVRPDGEVRTIFSTGRPVLNADGECLRVMGTGQDVTERAQAQQALAETEERMRFALEAAQLGVWETNLTTGASYWSPTCESLHGVGRGTLGTTADAFADLVHPEDRARVFQTIDEVMRERRELELEYRTVWPDGTEHRIAALGHFFYDESGVAVRGAGISTDVTERRALEERLRQAQKMEAVGQLAGGIAHDFNNMLTAIGGYTQLVLETFEDTDPRLEDLLQVRKAAERAGTLTRQLLAFSRRQILMPKLLDLNVLVTDLQKLLRRTIPENIELVVDLCQEVDTVRADPSQIEQVLLNLAVNASDAMPSGGQLRFATDNVAMDEAHARRFSPMQSGRYIRLIVKDTGMGMSPEVQERIFEPFFTTKALGKGTGLGLATVYGIVKQSGGFIWVTSEEGLGTTFEVYFPSARTALGQTASLTPSQEVAGGTETILVAEDDGAVRQLARDVLTGHGYHVIDACNGDEALSVAKERAGALHLLITDVVMPGLSGPELAKHLVAVQPSLRVLYTSGYADNVMMQAGMQSGFQLLAKPFQPVDLLRKVRKVLEA